MQQLDGPLVSDGYVGTQCGLVALVVRLKLKLKRVEAAMPDTQPIALCAAWGSV